jgi:hypothetical protein
MKLIKGELRKILKKFLNEDEFSMDSNDNYISKDTLTIFDGIGCKTIKECVIKYIIKTQNNKKFEYCISMNNKKINPIEIITPLPKEKNKSILGSEWKSCKQWGINKYVFGDMFTFTKTPNLFELTYIGPSTGISIAHASGSKGDTIHQIFNVLICEINPFLSSLKVKPIIDEIDYKSSKVGKNHKLTISVPLELSDIHYQLERRGGWGHSASDGKSLMNGKCKKNVGCYGPVTYVFQGSFGKITEHFITLPQ